jgi:hypothetical protein
LNSCIVSHRIASFVRCNRLFHLLPFGTSQPAKKPSRAPIQPALPTGLGTYRTRQTPPALTYYPLPTVDISLIGTYMLYVRLLSCHFHDCTSLFHVHSLFPCRPIRSIWFAWSLSLSHSLSLSTVLCTPVHTVGTISTFAIQQNWVHTALHCTAPQH